MFSAVIKYLLPIFFVLSIIGAVVLLSSFFVHGAEEVSNVTSTAPTTTTTTTAVRLDLSGEATGNVETSVQLDPGESRHRSKSHSYSNGGNGYAHQGPSYEKNEYEADRGVEYAKDPRQNEEYYNSGGENNYPQHHAQQHHRHPQPEDYADSYETPYERHHKNQEQSYEEERGKERKNPYPDHSDNNQTPYGHQDYSKEESYESKEDEPYRGGRPPYLQYAYEVTNKQQQATYDPLDVPDHDGKPGYGPGETKAYPPKRQQQQEHYPRPKPTRYLSKNHHKEEYQSDGQKENNYFPSVPKEAGYAPSGQKEPGYLQSPKKEYAYSKQAGYIPRTPEHDEFVPMLQKERTSADLDKLAILIKHLGHSSSGNGHAAKGRQGYLLLPVVPEKMEEKLREIGEGDYGKRTVDEDYGKDFRKSYQEVKEALDRQRPVIEKEVYIHQKVPVVQYPVEEKAQIAYGADYSHDQEAERPRSKSISHGGYGIFRPIIAHPGYADSEYESPKTLQTHAYSGGEVSEEGHAPYIPKSVADYEGGKEVKTYSRTSLVYGGPHGTVPSFTGSVKYEPASVYEKSQGYSSPYDVTTSHKTVPLIPKVRGYRPSTYASLPHAVDYPGVVDYSTLRNRQRKKSPGTSHLYSTQYRNIGTQLAAGYEGPKLDTSSKKGKSILVLQKPKDSEGVAHRPLSYSSRGRVSAKTLVDGFGLHDFESFLTKPRGGRPSSGSLYYDLHSFPAESGYGQLHYRKAGTKFYS